jgi:hypothetical protein
MAYANPDDLADEKKRADGYGLVRIARRTGRITFECWPRVSQGEQFPGWPIIVDTDDNDGRRVVAWLPELIVEGADRPVVQVAAEDTGEILYTLRLRGDRFRPPVYSQGSFTVRVGRNRPDGAAVKGVRASATRTGTLRVRV